MSDASYDKISKVVFEDSPPEREGNPEITHDRQREKLELIGSVARRVWGD